jgi:hypothetical protein
MSVAEKVQESVGYYSEVWKNAGTVIAPYLTEKSLLDKRRNMSEFSKSVSDLKACMARRPKSPADGIAEAWTADMKTGITAFSRTLLRLKDPELQRLLLGASIDSADRFAAESGKYDPDMVFDDIFQAMRNVWIMNVLQIIAGVPVEYTKPIFAYSLLYPYTDNYLDDPEIPGQEKARFNARLSKRLNGELPMPENVLEEKVFGLLEMIEEVYPRESFADVFESILCIQGAQIKSLVQQERGIKTYEQTLAISAEKGGTSVLADCFLVCGHPDDRLIRFSAGFGFLLQLIDDLEDIAADRAAGNATVFSSAQTKEDISDAVLRLIVFLHTALDYENASPVPYAGEIRTLFENNCMNLIFEAVFKNKDLFDKKLVRDLTKYSPFRPSYFARLKQEIAPLLHSFGKNPV